MDLEDYNRSFEEIAESVDEEADYKLRCIRQQCIKEFIDRLNRGQSEWERTFQDLLKRSQEETQIAPQNQAAAKSSLGSQFLETTVNTFSNLNFTSTSTKPQPLCLDLTKENQKQQTGAPAKSLTVSLTSEVKPQTPSQKQPQEHHVTNLGSFKKEERSEDPHFSNFLAIKEFIRVQELLNQNRKIFTEINTNPSFKSYKNDLTLFIRTQINSISNSDTQHLETKTRLLTNLFIGQKVTFQNRLIDASLHPQGQLFSMDLAAQTFVTVGTRLVNSVPAIAKSMATVINGIIENNLPIFKDLIVGHLQEQCPYLVPLHPNVDDFAGEKDQEARYKISCGYSFDTKTNSLESEEKYLVRMRSMVLIYSCILVQGHLHQSWSWLASFLSLKPEPVISATVLQAFLQESSKKMSSTYGRQYNKLLAFITGHYMKLLEEVTTRTTDKQSFIKLKNLLSDDSNLIATPDGGSIFRTIRLT